MRCTRLLRLIPPINPTRLFSRTGPDSGRALAAIGTGVVLFCLAMWLYPDSLRVNVIIRVGDDGAVTARLKAIELMLSPHHVALHVAPMAFVAVEYGDGLFAATMAPQLPHSAFITITDSLSLAKSSPNMVPCAAQMSLSRLAALQLASVAFEYQVIWASTGLLSDIANKHDFKLALNVLLSLSKWTLLELSEEVQDRLQGWYRRNSPLDNIHAAIARAPPALTSVVQLSVSQAQGPALMLFHHRDPSRRDLQLHRTYCTTLTDLLECTPSPDLACNLAAIPTTTTLTTPPRPSPATPRAKANPAPAPALAAIPTHVCGKGAIVEPVAGCAAPRPRALWLVQNDGWHKCRNNTHWLSGCRQFRP